MSRSKIESAHSPLDGEGETQETLMLRVAQLDPPPQTTPLTEPQQSQAKFISFEQLMYEHNQENFSDAIAHQQQSWCSQGWIQSYAELIVNYLYDLKKSNQYNTQVPLYLLEAEATTGQFGLGLLQALRLILRSHGLLDLNICYLFSLSNESDQEKLKVHPVYQQYEQQGQASIIHWDVLAATPLPKEDTNGKPLLLDENPMVFIANGLLSSLPQQCCYVHYSDLYQAKVATLDTTQELPDLQSATFIPWHLRQQKNKTKKVEKKLAYQWQATTVEEMIQGLADDLQFSVSQVLKQSLTQCRSEPLWIPITALTLLHQLKQRCSKSILCLQSDHGFSDLFPGSSTMPLVNTINLKSLRLPVHFNFLAQCQNVSNQSEYNWETLLQDRPRGKVINIAWLGENTKPHVSITQTVITKIFKGSTPEHSELMVNSLNKATDVLTEAQIMAYLVQQDYEPKLLEIFLPQLLKQGVDVDQRISWCKIISHVWNRYTPVVGQTELAFKLGLLAIDLSHWALARQCFLTVLQLQGVSLACLHNIALSAFATGDMPLAKDCIKAAVEHSPKDQQSQKLQSEISAYEERCQKLIWYTEYNEQVETSSIDLVPLDKQHLGEYYIQYRNPIIAKRVRGLEFNQFEELQQISLQWQEEADKNLQAHYAVLHADLGFVGGVLLDFDQRLVKDDETKPSARTAILSFWIGTDYQGYGFGSEAVKQAIWQMQQLVSQGVIVKLKASAWEHNIASQNLLKKSGFTLIEFDDIDKNKEILEVFYQLQ